MSHRLHVSLTTLILFAPLVLAASRPYTTAARAQATRHLTVIEGSGGGDRAGGSGSHRPVQDAGHQGLRWLGWSAAG